MYCVNSTVFLWFQKRNYFIYTVFKLLCYNTLRIIQNGAIYVIF